MSGSPRPLVQFRVEDTPTSNLSLLFQSWTGATWGFRVALWSLLRTFMLLFLAGSVIDIHLMPTILPISPYETVRAEAQAKRLILIVGRQRLKLLRLIISPYS